MTYVSKINGKTYKYYSQSPEYYRERYYAEHEKNLERNRKYKKENRERIRKRDREYYWNNLEKERARQREKDRKRRKDPKWRAWHRKYVREVYYPKNKDKLKKRVQKWKKENPEKVSRINKRYKSKKQYGEYWKAHRILLTLEREINNG